MTKMDTYQTKKDEGLGELWDCKEKIEDRAIKQSVEKLISLLDTYHSVDVLEILELLTNLKFEVYSNNFVYDENLEFDLSDVKRAINREFKIKRSASRGGRPSKVKEWLRKYAYLKEGYTYEFRDEEEFLIVAKAQLSRTTLWRLKKKLGID